MSLRPPVDRQRIIHFLELLGKIERGRDADFADVMALLEAGWLDFEALSRYFAEILPQVGERSLKEDPLEFQRKFAYLEAVWATRRA